MVCIGFVFYVPELECSPVWKLPCVRSNLVFCIRIKITIHFARLIYNLVQLRVGSPKQHAFPVFTVFLHTHQEHVAQCPRLTATSTASVEYFIYKIGTYRLFLWADLRLPVHFALTLTFFGFSTGTLRQSLFSRCRPPQSSTILGARLSVG